MKSTLAAVALAALAALAPGGAAPAAEPAEGAVLFRNAAVFDGKNEALSTGGGVSSAFDPLDVTEYTYEEVKAAVHVARTWNTYVAVQADTDDAIQMSLKAGVLSVEHGFPMSKDLQEHC